MARKRVSGQEHEEFAVTFRQTSQGDVITRLSGIDVEAKRARAKLMEEEARRREEELMASFLTCILAALPSLQVNSARGRGGADKRRCALQSARDARERVTVALQLATKVGGRRGREILREVDEVP